MPPHDESGPLPGVGGGSTVEKRPRQATTAGVLSIIFGALGILVGWVLLSTVNDAVDHGETVPGVFSALAYIQIVVSIAQIASGIFVLVGRPWARMLAVVICGVNILGGVVSLFTGSFLQALVGIVVNGVLIGMLSREDVRTWCQRDSARPL